jgi:hypothetical protein
VDNLATASATFGNAYAQGAGIYLAYSDDLISYNIIANDEAISDNVVTGGGIYVWYGLPEIINNTILGNSVMIGSFSQPGAGIYLDPSTATITNNIIDSNNGGGIFFDPYSYLTTVGCNDMIVIAQISRETVFPLV